jgi:glutamine amidotransferase
MRTVALIDYGSGNLPSADKALRKAAGSRAQATTVITTDDPETIARADAVVLPGVGAFVACMTALASREGVLEAMSAAVVRRGVPFLGICVGMQLLATRGLEFG